MKVSRNKTGYLSKNKTDDKDKVQFQDVELTTIMGFKYSGSTVQSNGEYGREVKQRVLAGSNGWRKIIGVIFHKKCLPKLSVKICGQTSNDVWVRNGTAD